MLQETAATSAAAHREFDSLGLHGRYREIKGVSPMTKPIPEGWHSVTPRLVVHNPAILVEFLKQAFDATGDLRTDIPSVTRLRPAILLRKQRDLTLRIGTTLFGTFCAVSP
jgi:hypothetical protein